MGRKIKYEKRESTRVPLIFYMISCRIKCDTRIK